MIKRILLTSTMVLLGYSAITTYIAAGVVKEAVITRIANMEAVRSKYAAKENLRRLADEQIALREKAAKLDGLEQDNKRLMEAADAAAKRVLPKPKPKPPEFVYQPSTGGIMLTEPKP